MTPADRAHKLTSLVNKIAQMVHQAIQVGLVRKHSFPHLVEAHPKLLISQSKFSGPKYFNFEIVEVFDNKLKHVFYF